ncbi:MAG: hypothetical protein AABZ53_11795 [Planctomycetota bacterium]
MQENEPTPTPPAPSQAKPVPSEDDLKRALSAFKKRIKLMILDQESHLGGGRPMTAGRKSEIQGIVPPNQFPREVWKELAARKQLKDMGGGFYALPK